MSDFLSRHYVQVTSLGSALALPQVPPSTRKVFVQATGQDVRWRADGIAPTASVGMLLKSGDTLVYEDHPPAELKFIEATSGAVLNITYFAEHPYLSGSGAPSLDEITCAGVGQIGVQGSAALEVTELTCSGSGTFT